MSYALDLFICEQLSKEDLIDSVFDHTDYIEECVSAHDKDQQDNSVSYKIFKEELG